MAKRLAKMRDEWEAEMNSNCEAGCKVYGETKKLNIILVLQRQEFWSHLEAPGNPSQVSWVSLHSRQSC
jgi:hypothetical protein